MKISGVDIRPGNIIEYEGGIWRAVKIQHTQPGKGGAFVRTTLKNVRNGAVVERTFRAGEKFPRILTSVADMQFLYDDGAEVVFMDTATYEQVQLKREMCADEVLMSRETMANLSSRIRALPVRP